MLLVWVLSILDTNCVKSDEEMRSAATSLIVYLSFSGSKFLFDYRLCCWLFIVNVWY